MDGASSLCQTAAGQPHPSVLSASPQVLTSCLSPLNSAFLSLISSNPISPLFFPPPRSFSFSLKHSLPVFSSSLPLPSPVLHLQQSGSEVDGGGQWQFGCPRYRRQHGQTLARLKLPSLHTSFCPKAKVQKVAFNDNSTKPLEHFYVEICVRLCEGLRYLGNPLFTGPQVETDFFRLPCSIACFYCATLADLFPCAYLDLRKLFTAASLRK